MRGRSRFISDMAQVANGAASALGGIREELDNIVKPVSYTHLTLPTNDQV